LSQTAPPAQGPGKGLNTGWKAQGSTAREKTETAQRGAASQAEAAKNELKYQESAKHHLSRAGIEWMLKRRRGEKIRARFSHGPRGIIRKQASGWGTFLSYGGEKRQSYHERRKEASFSRVQGEKRRKTWMGEAVLLLTSAGERAYVSQPRTARKKESTYETAEAELVAFGGCEEGKDEAGRRGGPKGTRGPVQPAVAREKNAPV